MKKILIAVLILLCCPRMHPQNVEGQIIAAQYGEYKVPGQSTGGFQFPSDTCQVSGGNKNFSAFATGVAVKIVDANPALTEIATPSSVYIGACTINMATAYNHVPPYYLTSGTGGLQEAITANEQGIAGPNSIILNAEWYSLIQPRSAATVIGSVQGNTQLPLVDVTTTPYTWYQWGGSAYAAVSIGGGGVPCIGVAAWNSNTAYVASQLACSGGTLYTATAGSTNQQPSSVSAFWTPTYYAGAGIAGSVIVGGQYFSGGSTDGSGNPVPSFVSSSTHTLDFEQQLGTDIFQWGAQNDGSTQNYWSLLLHNTSGSTANAHNFTVNWASNGIGHDEWHQSNDNFLCWASGDSATGCVHGLSLDSDNATINVGNAKGDHSGSMHMNNLTLDGSCSGCSLGGSASGALSGTYPAPQLAQKIVYVDNVNGTGVGVSPVAWAADTHYPWCQAVTHSGTSYIETALAGDSVTTPGANSTIWYPLTNTSTPTQLDCAFYTAAASIITGTGTVTAGNGASVVLGAGAYNTNIGFTEPTVPVSGNPSVSIFGQGKAATFITQAASKSDGNCMLQQPLATTGFAFASYVWQGFTLNANFNAPCVMGVYGSQQFAIKNLALLNAADGSDHYAEFGNASDTSHGWAYEADLEDIDISTYHGSGSGAVITASVSGGTPTITVANGGTGYNSSYVKMILSGTGSNADVPCSNRGADTITVSGGVITGITTTATGCAATVYAAIYGGQNVAYGMKFSNFTDSKMISSLTDGGVGATAGFEASNITSMNEFYKVHPINTYIGVQDSGNNDWVGTQMDSEYKYGFDFEGASNVENVYSSKFEWNGSQLLGSTDYHFGTIAGTPTNSPYAINIYGDVCGNAATFNGYNHFSTGAGSVDTTSNGLPTFVHVHETNYCNHITTTSNYANFIGTQWSMGPGVWGNVWNFAMSLAAGGAQSMTINNPLLTSGAYTWNWTTLSPATSGANYGSPTITQTGNYWNSSASAPFAISSALTFASGANPLATYTVGHTGTAPSGGANYTWDSTWAVVLPTGTTATTQTSSDNTTKVSTDAFVQTAVSPLAPLASPALTGTPTVPTASVGTSTTQAASTAFVQAARSNSEPLWGTDSGTGAAYVVTTTPTLASNTAGAYVCFMPHTNSSTTAPTLAVDSLTAETIVQGAGAILTGVPIQTVSPTCVINDGTHWVLQNSLQVDARTLRSVQGPASVTTGCILNASSSSQYACGSSLSIAPTAPAFNAQSGAAGPYTSYFDDFFSSAAIFSTLIGASSGSACATNNNTWEDQNHPGNLSIYSGTASSGTGVACTVGTASNAPQIITPNSSLGWTWESAVYVPVLPGTTAGSMQAGMAATVSADPWTTGIGFYLSSANGTANDWYCRYSSTSTDTTVAATVAWQRLTIVNDGAKVHWYIAGSEVCGTGVAIASIPSGTMLLGYSATLLNATPTAVRLVSDYTNFTRAVTR